MSRGTQLPPPTYSALIINPHPAQDITKRRAWFYFENGSREGASRSERLEIVKKLLSWKTPPVDLDAVDQAGRTALHYASKKSKAWPMAALLLDAGASIVLSDSAKTKIVENWLPVLRTAKTKFNNPLDGEVDFAEGVQCQTADCLLETVVKE